MDSLAMTAAESLDSGIEIRIVSGEGAIGNTETYNGKRTVRALKSRLTRECCNGDRWARAEALVSSESASGPAVYAEVSL